MTNIPDTNSSETLKKRKVKRCRTETSKSEQKDETTNHEEK